MNSTIVTGNCCCGDELAVHANAELNSKYALIMRLNMLYDRCVFILRIFPYPLIRAPPFGFEIHNFKIKGGTDHEKADRYSYESARRN